MALSDSVQPRKQRRARREAPLHARQKLVHAHVSKDARERNRIERRSAAVREGDKVRIMRGKFRGHTGKVTEVDLKSLKVYVEGAVARKAKGQEVPAAIEPSNLCITEFDFSDKRRKAILERKGMPGSGAANAGAPASG
ncbi:MAG: 50S ribosomal protein L24 [Candidatus ainarchaeum sp.]|nr:50S ribosomal protein L24 [Candidatus ainarchaeum sp.]